MKLSLKSKTQSTGMLFESQAKQFLIQQNLIFIEANSHCKFGEIDLIMLDEKTICFTEVKYRSNSNHSSALASITYSKQQKIKKSALYWLSNNPQYKRHFCRFDCIGIEPLSNKKSINQPFKITLYAKHYHLHWIKNAFA